MLNDSAAPEAEETDFMINNFCRASGVFSVHASNCYCEAMSKDVYMYFSSPSSIEIKH